jgi:hypothetical protein
MIFGVTSGASFHESRHEERSEQENRVEKHDD